MKDKFLINISLELENVFELLYSKEYDYNEIKECILFCKKNMDERVYTKELEKTVTKNYFDSDKNQDIILQNVDDLLENIKYDSYNQAIEVTFFLEDIKHYYEKIDFFYKSYERKMIGYVSTTKKDIEKLKSDIKEMDEQVKSYKFDIIGLIAGVLSLFTIFGANYSFINNYLSNTSIGVKSVLLLFFSFNFILLIVLIALMCFLKFIFIGNKDN